MENVGVKDNYIMVQRIKSILCFIVCLLLAAAYSKTRTKTGSLDQE